MRYILWYWVFQFLTLPNQHYLWFHLVWFFPLEKEEWNTLMHKGVPWRLSSPYQPRRPLLSTSCLQCSLLPWQPCGQAGLFPRSGYTATSVFAPKQLKEDSLRWCKEKRCTYALFRSSQCAITIAPLKLRKAFSKGMWCWNLHCIHILKTTSVHIEAG